jgi:hypothetical protein
MTEYRESRIVELVGIPNGSMVDFATPSQFLPGSVRIFWNGQATESFDERKGWTEVSPNLIRFLRAPRVGDVLQAYYLELSPTPGVGNVVGSPYDPLGIYP